MALFVLLMLGVSLALLALTMRVRLEEQQREVRRVRLQLLLDGVVDETLARLAIDRAYGGVAVHPSTVGEASTEVTMLGPTLVRIEARARIGPRDASAAATARIAPGPPRIVEWRRPAPDKMASGRP